jgi:hypothetical protein
MDALDLFAEGNEVGGQKIKEEKGEQHRQKSVFQEEGKNAERISTPLSSIPRPMTPAEKEEHQEHEEQEQIGAGSPVTPSPGSSGETAGEEDADYSEKEGDHYSERKAEDLSIPRPSSKARSVSSGQSEQRISLETLSPSVRFYSHVHLASPLEHEVMLLAKGPDNYPWSDFFRHAVLVQHKIPSAPYFEQLPSGERPDTLVLYSLPAIWFIDDDDNDLGAAPDDRLFNFTQRGHIIVQAAFMRFGPVKSVDLMFEMVSRDQEDSLTFDAYVQFKTFEGYSTAYYAMNGGILYDDRTDDQVVCRVDFDTTGYFCRQNRRLREARRTLGKDKREREEKAAKAQARREKRATKDNHVRLMKEYRKYKDRLAAITDDARPVCHLESIEKRLKAAGAALQKVAALTKPGASSARFESGIKLLKKKVEVAERIVNEKVAEANLKVPSLLEALKGFGDAGRFLELVHEQVHERPEQFHGVTLFVPPDSAFLDEFVDTWEDDCWGTHILGGPYQMQDLYILGNQGPGMLLCGNMEQTMNCRLNEVGEYVLWLGTRNQPRRVVRVIDGKRDIRVENGTILHMVDKIIYPDG